MTPRPPDQGSLFSFEWVGSEQQVARIPEPPLVRHTDPSTSHEAAGVIAEKLNAIQQAVYAAFLERGPASARQAEAWPELRTYGFSTVRKRVSELARAGFLVAVGAETESGQVKATVYRGVTP
jgi:hypothetical protein